MVEAIAAQPPKFTTIMYETKDGEKISATKKDGVVTLVGDKNGVRQMDLDKFIKEELPNNVKNLKLENSPEKDTVELSKPAPAAEVKVQAQPTDSKPSAPDVQVPKETVAAAVSNPITAGQKPEDKEIAEAPKKLDVVA